MFLILAEHILFLALRPGSAAVGQRVLLRLPDLLKKEAGLQFPDLVYLVREGNLG